MVTMWRNAFTNLSPLRRLAVVGVSCACVCVCVCGSESEREELGENTGVQLSERVRECQRFVSPQSRYCGGLLSRP